MATKTRAQMINWLLEHIGVKAASQSASAEDGDLVGRTIDSVHSRLLKEHLVNFTTAEFPEWAQLPFLDVAAPDLAGPYMIGGERLQLMLSARERGRSELAVQMQSMRPRLPVRVTDC